MMSLLDTWALAVQMKAFLAEGAAGGALFGTHQETVRTVSEEYTDDAEALARRLIAPREFDGYQRFIVGYTRDHPLRDLTFARASVIELWSRARGADVRLVDSLGTIPEALADAAERLQIYGDTVPAQAMRQTQLALRQSGYSRSDLQTSLRHLDERLERLSAVAESTPALVHGAEAEVRRSLREVLERLDASSALTVAALRTERAALFTDLQSEREAVLAAIDVQRKALALDAGRIAAQVVKSAGEQARYLVGEALLLLMVLAIIVLGLSFIAGYFVGRARHRHARGGG
jgi:Mg2+ and Co2+ transporter CorA